MVVVRVNVLASVGMVVSNHALWGALYRELEVGLPAGESVGGRGHCGVVRVRGRHSPGKATVVSAGHAIRPAFDARLALREGDLGPEPVLRLRKTVLGKHLCLGHPGLTPAAAIAVVVTPAPDSGVVVCTRSPSERRPPLLNDGSDGVVDLLLESRVVLKLVLHQVVFEPGQETLDVEGQLLELAGQRLSHAIEGQARAARPASHHLQKNLLSFFCQIASTFFYGHFVYYAV